MRSTIRHELPAPNAETFWREVFFSPEIQEQIYKELGYLNARVESQEGSLATGLKRRFVFVQPVDAPGPLKKVFGMQQTLTEQGEFDPVRGEYRFTMTLDGTLGKSFLVRGVTRVNERGDGTIERVCEIDFECSIFGVGGLAERFMRSSNEAIYERRAQLERKVLSTLPPPPKD
jgi:hypothetical protein